MKTPIVRTLAFVLLATSLAARTDAQVGGLINRAKKAVIEDNKTVSNAQIGDPFDAASLDAALKGMKVYKARMSAVAALQKQYLDNANAATALEEKNERQLEDFRVNTEKIGDCQREFISQRREDPAYKTAMQQKMMESMMDPANAAEFARIGQALTEATQKQDTAQVRKLSEQYSKLMGIDFKADTTAAEVRCGKLPAPPAAIAEIERLRKQNDDVNRRLRSAESSADVDAARAAGVQPARFQQMRERLTTWVGKPDALGSKEGDLLKGRKAEIEEVIKTP